MSSVKKIICLANSWKLQERCIAGINVETETWIRPVSEISPNDGKVPASIRLIEGKEPELLDILAIPLAETGNDFGFECENLTILAGEWKLLRKAKPSDLIRYCKNSHNILHNSWKYVNPSYLESLPPHERLTLQLVQTSSFSVTRKSTGRTGWQGTIRTISGQTLNDVKITDPVFAEKLEAGYQPKQNCLVTVSLSMPWAPPNWEGEDPCWKLIAGVIEL
jgi:hypothetical protein